MGEKRNIAKNMLFEQSKKIYLTVIAIIFTYVIANFLGPESYGEVIYFITLTASIQNLFAINFIEALIFVFVSKYKSKQIFSVLIKYQTIINLVLVIILFLFAEDIVRFVNQQNVFLFKSALLLLVFMPIYMSLLALCRSFKSFGKVFKAQSLMQTINLILATLFVVVLGIGSVGVIFAQLISGSLVILLLISYYLKFNYSDQSINYKKEIIDYSKPSFVSNLVRMVEDSISLVVIGIYSTPLLLGYYYFSQKVIFSVIGKSASTIRDVLSPYTLENWGNKTVLENYISIGVKLNVIFSTLFGIVVLLVAIPLLNIFMPDYAGSVMLIVLFLINAVLGSINFIKQVFMSLNKMNLSLKSHLITFFIYVPFLFYLASLYSLYGVLYAQIINQLVLGFCLFYYAKKLGLHIAVIPTLQDVKYFMHFLKFRNVKSMGSEIFKSIKK